MNKICFIVPYFGKLPNYFQLFLKSCENNSEIDWIIIGDDSGEFDYPLNVFKINLQFSELQELIRKKFDFEIRLETPYKLCDYKVAYGYIFEDYLVSYDFWGYCDIDLIFGNISNFITTSILNNYDKIGHLGHFTLFKNTPDNNMAFMHEIDGRKRYQEVFTTDRICVFDEWDDISINDIFFKTGKKIYLDTTWADIYPFDSYMRMVKYDIAARCGKKDARNYFFIWNNGVLLAKWRKKSKLYQKEIMYVHLQKRKMKMESEVVSKNNFYIFPDRFIDCDRYKKYMYFLYCSLRRILNIKRWIHFYYTLRYWLIKTSSPLRHKIKAYLLKMGDQNGKG